jgi:hypothetical protein
MYLNVDFAMDKSTMPQFQHNNLPNIYNATASAQ